MASEKATGTAKVTAMSFHFSSFLTVHVGPEDSQQEFLLHEGIICARSDFFRRAMNGNWAEKTERLIKLPEDGPETFDIYVNLVYTNTISMLCLTRDLSPERVKDKFQILVQLYILAEKLRDSRAKNDTISVIHGLSYDNIRDGKTLPEGRAIQTMYDGTPEGSLGRSLLVDLWWAVGTKEIIEDS
ncbi:hypothetical protein BDW02DRAFT_539081 [Decorospora gaudefroyi]|uniref:BTB domain-containing protein n=1 Tax=Decorospora gaudefroyi TaxID=184978 RepID=A0A6A5KTR5_9PLEO|nr:hypothetical protein BDW02DRAFT_539081 [Decorospora gaudefroyi]